MSVNVFPLINVPVECFPTSGPMAAQLEALRMSCLKVDGYILIRDTSVESHNAATFTFKNSTRLKLSMEGDWLLGRIHNVKLNHHVSVVAWDPLGENAPYKHVYVRTLFGPKGLADVLKNLKVMGSREVLENDSPFAWVFKPANGIFDMLKGEVDEPASTTQPA